jgi:hypothetical protein
MEVLGSCYKFNFKAAEAGEASVHFIFADPNTFNIASVEVKIQVEPRRNKSETITN